MKISTYFTIKKEQVVRQFAEMVGQEEIMKFVTILLAKKSKNLHQETFFCKVTLCQVFFIDVSLLLRFFLYQFLFIPTMASSSDFSNCQSPIDVG